MVNNGTHSNAGKRRIGSIGGTLHIGCKRTWPCDIWIVKRYLDATLCDPCIRVSLSKSSCEETPEEPLRVNCQSLYIHLLTDKSSRTPADRRTQPDQSGHSGTTPAKTTVPPLNRTGPTAFQMRTCLGVTQPKFRAMKVRPHRRGVFSHTRTDPWSFRLQVIG
jgi:hypothetical protein